jgi:hypothetical protein
MIFENMAQGSIGKHGIWRFGVECINTMVARTKPMIEIYHILLN